MYWEHDADGTFSETLARVTGGPLAFTVEFCRFQQWNRTNRTFQSGTPGWPRHFAHEWLAALATLPGIP